MEKIVFGNNFNTTLVQLKVKLRPNNIKRYEISILP